MGLSDSVEDLLSDPESNDEDGGTSSPTSLSDLTRNQNDRRSDSGSLWTPDDLLNLDDRDYERLIGVLYVKKGYEAAITPKSGDGGVDVIAVKDGGAVLIEAKRLSGNYVPVGQVRELYSVAQDVHSLPYDFCDQITNIDGIAVFTTSGLSREAGIRLRRIDRQEDYPAWLAKSQTMCDLLNQIPVSKNEWREIYDENVVDL